MKKWLTGMTVAGLVSAWPVLAEYKVDGWGRLQYVNNSQILGETASDFDEAEFEARLNELDSEDDADLAIEANEAGLNLILEDESGTGTGVGTQNELVVEDRWEGNGVTVRAVSKSRIVVESHGVGAGSSLPVKIKLETNTVALTTSGGDQEVRVLPDVVLAKLLADNVIDELVASGEMELAERPDQSDVMYLVPGVSGQKLLGLIKLQLARTVWVSARTGEIVKINQDIKNRVLDWVAF